YANGAFIPGGDTYVPRWIERAAAFRTALGDRARLSLAYGPAPRNRLDLFLPEAAPRGLMVFVHGGYWIESDRDMWSHLAAGALGRGWAVVLPSYTLAPAARITEMGAEVAAAIRHAVTLVPGPLVVTGHSAGGHLSARIACADVDLPALRRVVPISPLADLAPLAQTAMNDSLRLDPAECASESPARLPLRAGVQAHVWVGGQERPAFLWHARLLSEAWSCPWTVDPPRHHFDVIAALEDSRSPLMETCLAGL
ncbi:MAG: hypothetical protein RIT14_2106, partial [Pseudomonadota bacterium]